MTFYEILFTNQEKMNYRKEWLASASTSSAGFYINWMIFTTYIIAILMPSANFS